MGSRLVTALRHFEAGRLNEAASACEAILHRSPNDWLALRLLGHIRISERAFDQAVQLLTAALQAAPPDVPDVISMLNGLAEALRGKQDLAGAFACCRGALARNPRDVATLLNYGETLTAANRHADALEQFRLARAQEPDSVEARLHEGVAMLALGMWSEGFERFEERLSMPHPVAADLFPKDVPHWRGESDIVGKTVLLHAEQGLGDTIQFVRYAPIVAALGARVVMRVQPPLGKLLTALPGVATTVSYTDAVPPVDVQCPILSLPSVFRTTLVNPPAQVPYLFVFPEYLMVWQALLGPRRRRRIGIVWSGRPHPPLRSLPLATLAPLLARSDLEFHALQKEIPNADREWLEARRVVVDHSAQQKDFMDTAAVISLMDLVITIDTSVAHLAGALGKPVWIMLPFSADWRWMVGRSDSPWYPTARLFRQKRPGDWEGVIAEVEQAVSM